MSGWVVSSSGILQGFSGSRTEEWNFEDNLRTLLRGSRPSVYTLFLIESRLCMQPFYSN